MLTSVQTITVAVSINAKTQKDRIDVNVRKDTNSLKIRGSAKARVRTINLKSSILVNKAESNEE